MARAFCGIPAKVVQRQFNVPLHRQLGDQVETLENKPQMPEPDVAEGIVPVVADIPALEHIPAAGQPVQAADNIHQGTFTGPARAHDGPETAPGKGHINAA
jgi:hypothetical protein